MDHRSTRTTARVMVAGSAAVLAFVTLASTAAATSQVPSGQPHGLIATHAVQPALGQRVAPHLGGPALSKSLNYEQQVQQNDEWCWAADGSSIEQSLGGSASQEEFCAAGNGVEPGNCPNAAAEVDTIVRGFQGTGFSANSAGGTISYSAVQQQINNGMPALAGIYWTSGGGHAEVIYGYDTSNNTMMLGDPWPTYQRYQTSTYNNYLRNSQFTWGDTVVNIQKG